MRNIFTIVVALLITGNLWAQAPNKLSYQALVRDGSNELVTDQPVGMQISILKGSIWGSAVYVETQTPTSNSNGLVSLEIGAGTLVLGSFTSINWSAGPYFIKTETDPTGGTNYTITGTSQLMSVPYALHANTADSIIGGTSFTEVDGSVTNEIQDLQLVGNLLSLNNNGAATTIDLSPYLDNTNTQLDSTDITNLGFVAGGITTEVDGSVTNEIQQLSVSSSGDTLYLQNGGFVIIPGISLANVPVSPITDADGNVYTSVKIGTQEWMVQNLRTTKYSDGTAIPNVTGNTQWKALSTGAWCHYDNDSSQYEATYGKLYNWHAVNTSKLCPTDWHVPTDAEWTVLTDYLSANGHDGKEGTALKATSGWSSGGNGTDEYGWLGLPGGYRDANGNFGRIDVNGYWWSSSEDNKGNSWISDAWVRYIHSGFGNVYRNYSYKEDGFSVRCLSD